MFVLPCTLATPTHPNEALARLMYVLITTDNGETFDRSRAVPKTMATVLTDSLDDLARVCDYDERSNGNATRQILNSIWCTQLPHHVNNTVSYMPSRRQLTQLMRDILTGVLCRIRIAENGFMSMVTSDYEKIKSTMPSDGLKQQHHHFTYGNLFNSQYAGNSNSH